MGDILINAGLFNGSLNQINKGFLEERRQGDLKYNAAPQSDFPSMLEIINEFVKMDSVLKSYDAFLKRDVAECKKIGESFEEIDQAYKNAFGGP